MGGVGVIVEAQLAGDPEDVFALFGRGQGPGWVFELDCDRLARGAPVRLQLPLAGTASEEVTILGRVATLSPPRRLDIVCDFPWQGRLRIRCDAQPRDDSGHGRATTRVRVMADLGDDGLGWLLRHRGAGVDEELLPGEHPLGLLLSQSGPGAVFAGASSRLAALAVDEVNADGGIQGRPLRLLLGDDATNPDVGVREADRLVRVGCRTLLATTTSATFGQVSSHLRGRGVLLVHTLMNEGGRGDGLRLQFGERPQAQLDVAVGPVMAHTAARHWFMAGNDYVWPRLVHKAAKRALARHQATIVGEAFAPLGTRDFTGIIAQIIESDADLVLSSFVGADLVAFERQCHALGVRQQCTSLALALDEPTRERIGDEAAEDMWGVSGYFAELPDGRNVDFLQRYRARFGELAPPVSSIAESTYEAIHLYAVAARLAGENEPRSIARELRHGRSLFPRGPVRVDGPETVHQRLLVARAERQGFAIEHEGPLDPVNVS